MGDFTNQKGYSVVEPTGQTGGNGVKKAAFHVVIDNPEDITGGEGAPAGATEAKQDVLIARVGEVQASPTANTVLDRIKSLATALTAVLVSLASILTGVSSVDTKVGEVQASPTANTILDRLKSLATALTSLITSASSIDTKTGEVQASPTANTVLDRLKTIGTSNTSIDTKTGEVQASPTANTVLDRLKSITTGLTALLTGIVLSSGENIVGKVVGSMIVVSASFTRESNATAYTAGDVVSSAAATFVPSITLSNCARANGGSGYITGFRITMNDKTKVPTFRVHVYSLNTAVAGGDNLGMDERYADVAKKIASFDLAAMTSGLGASNDISRTQDFTLRVPFICDAASRNLYIVLEATLGFTPASGSLFTVSAFIDQN